MTLVREYQPTFVLGDGETKEFSYLFEEVSENFVKVVVKHSDDSTYVPVFSVDLDSHKVVFGESETAPLDTDVVCIYRDTPDLQDTPFRTLQGYDARALENILSKIVAMIQEMKSNGFSTQILQGTPWQLDLLHPADDNASVVIDYNARILKKGLYFQIVSGNLQVSADGNSFISMPKSADITEFRCLETVLEDLTVIRKLQYKVNNVWYDADVTAQATADEALDLAQTVQGDLSSHKLNHNNPHETSLGNLTDVDFTNLQTNQFLKFNGTKWVNVSYSSICAWGGIIGTITNQTDLMAEFAKYVRTDGSSTMTNPLMMRATQDFKCAIAPYWDGVGFFKLNDNNSVTLMASIEYNSGFEPATTNTYNIGASARKWKNLYLSGKAYVSVINNGYDIAIPVTNSADTLALKSEVDLAANSGRMITDQGVWFAKMYAASTVPTGAEYDGKNYADFSQVDSDNNPVIKIYTGASGAWTLTETITPPADYDGYVPITSKIWDIVEQTGQQGGRVLWNHQSKDFTPYPQIISFDNQNITNSSFSGGTITSSTFDGEATLSGVSTAPTPTDASPNDQIATKEYVDSHSSTGGYHPDLFDWKWADHQLDDVQWLRADTFSWQSGSVYQAAFWNLFYDMQVSTYWYGGGGPAYTKSRTPAVGDAVYLNSDLTTQIGTVESYDDVNDEITVSGDTYSFMSNTYVTPTTETVAGYTVTVYTGHSGKKIVSVSDETNVANIYSATGVAWYYIIDIPNKQFKLPRGKHEHYGDRPVVGNGSSIYVRSSGGTVGDTRIAGWKQPSNAGYKYLTTETASQTAGSNNETVLLSTDSTKSGIISTPVQDTDQYKYLYFYVGEFTQTAIENTAGINAEDFNAKADTDFGNTSMIDYVVAKQDPSAGNGYTWYRKYKSGWVEQGGITNTISVAGNSGTNVDVTLPITMADTNYNILTTRKDGGSGYAQTEENTNAISTSVIRITLWNNVSGTASGGKFWWEVRGMAA